MNKKDAYDPLEARHNIIKSLAFKLNMSCNYTIGMWFPPPSQSKFHTAPLRIAAFIDEYEIAYELNNQSITILMTIKNESIFIISGHQQIDTITNRSHIFDITNPNMLNYIKRFLENLNITLNTSI